VSIRWSIGLSAGLAMLWLAHGVGAQVPAASILSGCLDEVRAAGGDIATCRGTITEQCMVEIAEGDRRDSDRTFCLQREGFAWGDMNLSVGTAYLRQMEGRAGFSKDAYIDALGERLSAGRASCFDAPIGQEEQIQECIVDRNIEVLRWAYQLLDDADG